MAIREALTASLAAAMRRRDAGAVSALRAALSALANAEAAPPVDPPDPSSDPAPDPATGPATGMAPVAQHFAGAAAGLGATEVARAELTEAQIRTIVAGEHADLREHAARLARIGRADEAASAQRGAAALAEALDEAPEEARDEQPDRGGPATPGP